MNVIGDVMCEDSDSGKANRLAWVDGLLMEGWRGSGASFSVEGEDGGVSGSSTGSVRFRVVTLRTISSGEGSRSVGCRVSSLSITSGVRSRSVDLRVVALRINGSGEGILSVGLHVVALLTTGSGEARRSVGFRVVAFRRGSSCVGSRCSSSTSGSGEGGGGCLDARLIRMTGGSNSSSPSSIAIGLVAVRVGCRVAIRDMTGSSAASFSMGEGDLIDSLRLGWVILRAIRKTGDSGSGALGCGSSISMRGSSTGSSVSSV